MIQKSYIHIVVVQLGMYTLILITKYDEQKHISSFKKKLVALVRGKAGEREPTASSP